MNNNYNHIIKHEKTLNQFNNKIQELDNLLSFLETHHQDFTDLMDYYQSDQRQQDLKDDDNHQIPEEINRGVLSEDAIYDLYSEYQEASLKMLELGTKFFKG